MKKNLFSRRKHWKILTSSVPKRKEVKRIGKDWEEIIKTISYKLQFIDGARFVARSVSNLVNNLAIGIHKTKCKFEYYNKECETCKTKYKDCECFLEYTNVKVDLIECKCLCFNKNYQKKLTENLKKKFANTYKFSNHDVNKFILLLWKGVYPC